MANRYMSDLSFEQMQAPGLRVFKIMGYGFDGTVVSAFRKLEGDVRVVVECTVPGCEGMLHIFSPEQLGVKDA